MNNTNTIGNHRILVVDDNPSIHEDIRKILAGRRQGKAALADTKALLFGPTPADSGRTVFEIDSAFQGEEGLRLVQQAVEAGRPYAVAFVDVRMPPGWDGVETVTRIWKDHPELQIVICTAYSDYSWEDMIRKLGVSDSLVILKKPFDNIEVLQLAHALTEKWGLHHEVKCRLNDLDQLVLARTSELASANEKLKNEIAERMQMEKALRLSEERFSKAFKASPIPLAIQSLKQEKYVDANQGFHELTGYSREELIGRTPEELQIWDGQGEGSEILQTLHAQMSIRNKITRLRTKSGQLRDIILSAELFELDAEPFMLIIVQDITEQIKLEDQLRQSQKMEAVGQLAAGIAHDFNNILTVIQGYSSMLLGSKTPGSSEYKPVQTICAAADRATKLVRQLLTFSRKQFVERLPVNMRDIVSVASEMLPRVLGEHINVKVVTPSTLPLINADAGMMEQMLMNLAVNARDAMPEGGTLTIGADTVQVGAEAALTNQESRAGQFVCLSVSDTGCGIAPDLLRRIFEPFFTTKAVGKGTGLGLATVYGIAKQHDGWVEVDSHVNQGSTFKVFIPVSNKQPGVTVESSAPRLPRGGNETILVVEDESDVRDFVVETLQGHGYAVSFAGSGAEVLDRCARREQKFDLLLTDVVMPGGVSGRQLAERLVAREPSLKVIYTSGYSPGMTDKDMELLEGQNFLAKPYRPAKLLQSVRECLDRARQPETEAETVLPDFV